MQWHDLSRDEQYKYYEKALVERKRYMQMESKRESSLDNGQGQKIVEVQSETKKPRVSRFKVQPVVLPTKIVEASENAYMLYMKEMRPKIVAECTLKESAAINQILGRRVRYEIRIFFSYPFNLLYFSGTALAGKNKPSITNKRVRNANYICKCILVGQPETIMLKVRRKNGNESQKQHQVGCR